MKRKDTVLFIASLVFLCCLTGKTEGQQQNIAGTSLEFDGVNDYVSGSGISLPFGSFQIEAWIYNNNLTDHVQRYITINPEVAVLRHDGTGSGGYHQLHFYTRTPSGTLVHLRVNNILTTGEWMHIAANYDGLVMRLYVNGKLVASESQPDGLFTPNGDFMLSSGSEPMAGKMDEVRIWEGDLWAHQIRENMYLNYPSGTFSIKHYWQFNEGSGNTITDCIGNCIGTLHNMDNGDWMISDFPFGSGHAESRQVTSTGVVDFWPSGISMDFTGLTGNQDITVTRIDTMPNIKPSDSHKICDSQYWVVKHFEDGTFNTSLTFTVNEDLLPFHETYPFNVKLYTRPSNSGQDWTFCKSAVSVDAAENTATFNAVTGFGQYIISSINPDNFAGNALEFDGNDDYISGSGIRTSLTAITIEAWVNHNTLTESVQRYVTIDPEVAVLRHDGTTFGGYHELHFYIKKSNGTLFSIRVDSVESVNEWMHIAGTYDGSTLKLYLQGELLDSVTTSTGGLFPPSGDFHIGSSSESFHGKMDEVRIWDRALTRQEIRETMYLNGLIQGIENYWQFNEESGNTVIDCVGNSNGTMYNMNDSNRVDSSIPFGSGISTSRDVSTTGEVIFTDTDLSVDFTGLSVPASFTVTRIDTTPNILPVNPSEDICDSHYWIVNSYGNGNWTADFSFSLNDDLNSYNQHDPASISLYTRESNADGDWSFLMPASSVDAITDIVTFSSVTASGQYLISRGHPDDYGGTALEFDGMNDYAELANNTDFGFGSSFTVETWIKPGEMSTGSHVIARKGTEWKMSMYVYPGLIVFEFGINNNSLFSTYTIGAVSILNYWVHVAGVVNQEAGNKHTLVYLNGNAGTNETANTISLSNDHLRIGEDFNGVIDEFRVWKEARTINQIREYRHLTSTLNDTLMSSYLQFNEGTGNQAVDVAGGNEATLYNMDSPACWINSGVPAGGGVSNTQNEAGGLVNFSGTGLSIYYNAHHTASVTVTGIHSTPNLDPSLFDSQYWFVDRYGSGTYNADMTFSVNEDITPDDEVNPGQVKLYRRGANADTEWEYFTSAGSVNTSENQTVFTGITSFSQFAVCRRYPADNFAGNALDFDGGTDSLIIINSNSLNIAENFTVEAWIKPAALNNNRDILRKGDIRFLYWDAAFETASGKGIQINLPGLNTGWWEFEKDMNSNNWYHVVYTLSDDGELKGYINGINVRTGFFTGKLTLNDEDMIIASGLDALPFSGKIDELRIWNTVRTQTEIREDMYRSLAGLENGLVSYWQFNEDSGTNASDRMGGNDGSLMNMNDDNWVNSTAPLPFISAQNGSWEDLATWLDGQSTPDSAWARVRIDHNVVLNTNKELIDLSIVPSGRLTVEPQTHLTVSDSLNNQADVAGLLLKAGESGNASLLHNKPDIPGTVESYLQEDQWHLVSSPVGNALSETFLDIYLKYFTEADSTWTYILPTNYPLERGTGFSAWSSSSTTGNATVQYEGILNTGDLPVLLSYTESATHGGKGWNLIGNPFPSALEWTNQWSQIHTDNTIYIYNGVQYVSWNHNNGGAGFGTKGNGDIPVGQGFWVKANNTGASLTIPQSNRKHTGQNFYKGSSKPENFLTFDVEGNGYSDKMIIYFNDQSTPAFDHEWDACKMKGIFEAPQIYCITPEGDLSVDVLPFDNHEITIPVGCEVGNKAIYTLHATGIGSFDQGTKIFLQDMKENETFDLREQQDVNFIASPTDPENRFFLHFTNSSFGLEENTLDQVLIYNYGSMVYFQFAAPGKTLISIFDISGRQVYEQEAIDPTVTLPVYQKAGVYLIRIIREHELKTVKIIIH